MGTRHLTAVYYNGEYKVAQYGQWDGYPEGQGLTCLSFLTGAFDEEKFKAALEKCSFISEEEYSFIFNKYGGENGFISVSGYSKLTKDYPELSRDTGAEILEIIQNSDGLKLRDELTFAADSLFCEWAWVIDLDARTFEAYRGFNRESLQPTDRFWFLAEPESGNDYHGVKIVAEWSIDDLPSEKDFLAAFAGEE